jgi:hypothetical protein
MLKSKINKYILVGQSECENTSMNYWNDLLYIGNILNNKHIYILMIPKHKHAILDILSMSNLYKIITENYDILYNDIKEGSYILYNNIQYK